MVARGAGAARPMLLAGRQWEPLGLARWLPSLVVGAWRSAPLLPWRVQCSVRVCAALAVGSGGSGRYLVLCLSRSPHPALGVPRCVRRALPSGCPLPSLAATPFHAVCEFLKLGPVALLVVPVCPLHVSALALPRRPPPPPWVVWRAHLARSWHWALVESFHVVRAPPRLLPWSFAPSGVSGGGRSGPRSPLPGLGLLLRGASEVRRSPFPDCPPTGRAVEVRYPRAVGAGVLVWGSNTVPLACMPCGGWWGRGAVPGGGWPATVVRGIWCQALSLPRPPVLWGGQPGYRDPCVPGAVGAGVGTQHRLHSVRPCGPALLALGVAEGRPRGGCLPLL